MSDQEYDRAQAEQILERAAELDAAVPAADERMTLGDLESVARESGIDPAMVRRAASDLQLTEETTAKGFSLLGGPTRLVRGVTIDAPDDLELISDLAADHFVDMGTSRVREGRLRWRTTGQSRRAIELAARVGPDRRVSVQVTENLGALAGSLYGGIGGGLGGGLGGGFSAFAGMLFGGAGVAVWLILCITFALGLARMIFSRIARQREASLDAFIEQLHRLPAAEHVALDFDEAEEQDVMAEEHTSKSGNE